MDTQWLFHRGGIWLMLRKKKKQKTLEINTLSFLASPPLLESPVEWGSAVVRDLA